jgi:hypothetical protein
LLYVITGICKDFQNCIDYILGISVDRKEEEVSIPYPLEHWVEPLLPVC